MNEETHCHPLLDVVWESLSRIPPTISPQWFYDSQGSALFDQITAQPEYYLTRCELEILSQAGADIADWLGHQAVVLELGAGNGEKATTLSRALHEPLAYVPVDISPASLDIAVKAIRRAIPGLKVEALCHDFLEEVPWPTIPASRRCVVFFGSTIGNMEPQEAAHWLGKLRGSLEAHDRVLLGVDLKKDTRLLNAAYNDAAGITARFNRNALAHLNRALGTDFEVDAFLHHAAYNPDKGRMDMYLEALRPQTVHIGDRTMYFALGDRIHTESSYKYTIEEFQVLAEQAGFRCERVWLDERDWFSLHGLLP